MPNTPSKSNSLPAVLITGCSSGLGHALALRFVKAGHPTYATATVEQQHGQVGILINNAAIGLMTPIETVPIEQVRQQYETSVFGVLAVTQAVIPGMH